MGSPARAVNPNARLWLRSRSCGIRSLARSGAPAQIVAREPHGRTSRQVQPRVCGAARNVAQSTEGRVGVSEAHAVLVVQSACTGMRSGCLHLRRAGAEAGPGVGAGAKRTVQQLLFLSQSFGRGLGPIGEAEPFTQLPPLVSETFGCIHAAGQIVVVPIRALAQEWLL